MLPGLNQASWTFLSMTVVPVGNHGIERWEISGILALSMHREACSTAHGKSSKKGHELVVARITTKARDAKGSPASAV